MKQFNGFPARMQFTPIPNFFISNILPEINDMAELRTTLHLFRALYGKRGYPRFITYGELLADKSLMSSLKGEGKSPQEALNEALEMAVKRGTIINLVVDKEGTPEDVYFLNTESDRRAVAKIQNGELALAGLKAARQPRPDIDTELPPDIFTLYEDNIGMLTPMIADELREAEKLYPQDWISDAIKEAVSLNKRSWRYIARILERWLSEGRGDGTYQRDIKKADQDKYSQQRYGHIFKR